METPKLRRWQADDVIVVAAWVLAVGSVLAASMGSLLLVEPVRRVLETSRREVAQSLRPPAPDSNEASVELGILYPVNGPVPNETEMRAAQVFTPKVAAPPPERSPEGKPTVVVNPSWAETPRPDYPMTAASRNIENGRVQLECFVRADGLIAACMVLNETPPGVGFGRAALAAARDARLQPRTVDGVSKPGRIRFSTSFRLQ